MNKLIIIVIVSYNDNSLHVCIFKQFPIWQIFYWYRYVWCKGMFFCFHVIILLYASYHSSASTNCITFQSFMSYILSCRYLLSLRYVLYYNNIKVRSDSLLSRMRVTNIFSFDYLHFLFPDNNTNAIHDVTNHSKNNVILFRFGCNRIIKYSSVWQSVEIHEIYCSTAVQSTMKQ